MAGFFPRANHGFPGFARLDSQIALVRQSRLPFLNTGCLTRQSQPSGRFTTRLKFSVNPGCLGVCGVQQLDTYRN